MESMALGVVVERRQIDNPWQDYQWSSVAVIPGAPPVEEWRQMQEGEGWVHYHVATLPLELFRRETEGYKQNLSNEIPVIYVVLRQGEEAEESEIEASLVTVCPFEAQDYLDSGDDLVDRVAMPESVMAWVATFVEKHHVHEPFHKRKRKNWTKEERRRSPTGRGNGSGGRLG